MSDAPDELDLPTAMDTLVNATLTAMLIAGTLPLAKLEETFQRALDIGPLLLPTEWIRGNANATVNLRLVRAWLAFAREIREVELDREHVMLTGKVRR
jgi:hypothetical protein